MILPQTHTLVLLLTIASILCWGLWVNTFKVGGRRRFELYYFDFAFGVGIAALLIGFTLGNLGFDGFALQDDLMNAGKREWLYAFVAGVLFNFANELLMGAVSVIGMASAFPIALGLALVLWSLLNHVLNPGGGTALLVMGCALVLGAVTLAAVSSSMMAALRREELARAGKTKDTRRRLSPKGMILALVSGLFMAGYFPLVEKAQVPDIGLGPYATMLMMAIGVAVSTFAFNIFFLNLPVEGQPLEVWEYFRLKLSQHFFGMLGGALWVAGVTAALVSAAAPAEVQISPATAYSLAHAAALLTALCGLVFWKEYRGADIRVLLSAFLVFVLYGGGLALIVVALQHGSLAQ